jgi:rhomboid protease GluP
MGYGSAIAPEKNLATQTLIGINSFVFALEVVSGGSQDLEVLYRLGALVPQDVWAGEWWRVFNAIFLHAGIVHLLANMLGLYVFGKRVESVLGIRKFLLGYFTCGIGSMLTVTILAILTQAPVQVTVGASGAIMGLVGIEMAILLKSWHRDKGKYARDRLRLILMVTGLQIISDLLTPQVSVIGHFSGLTLGLLIGSIL